MSSLVFAQAFAAIACLIAIVVGFVFWGGFICGRLWQARVDERIDGEDKQ